MSALSNLAGLFPPTAAEIWNSNIPWQPIPVHTIPEKLDHILAGRRPCPKFDRALKQYKSASEYRELNRRFKPLYEYLTQHSGKKIDSLTSVNNLYNTLFIENLYNLTLPKWTEQVFPGGDMEWVSGRSFATKTNTKTLARLKSGFLLKDILDRCNDKKSSHLSPDRKMWIYSAHDTTIGSMLNTLGVFDVHCPPYTASIMFELRLKNGEPYVQVFYRNTTDEHPPALHIPNCGQLCSLEKMYTLYRDVLPADDFETECRLSSLSMAYEEEAHFGGSKTGIYSNPFTFYDLRYCRKPTHNPISHH